MAVLTKQQLNDIMSLKRHYCHSIIDSSISYAIKKYSHLSIGKKYELSKILYNNLTTNIYSSLDDCENAEKILTDLLNSITEEDINTCQIIDDRNIDELIKSMADDN